MPFPSGSDSGILVSFFGRDGSKKLALAEFTSFLVSLHEEVVRLEFAHYDVAGRGSIPALDFARSLVATADVRHVDKLLDKVGAGARGGVGRGSCGLAETVETGWVKVMHFDKLLDRPGAGGGGRGGGGGDGGVQVPYSFCRFGGLRVVALQLALGCGQPA